MSEALAGSMPLVFHDPLRAATGYCAGSLKRGSKKVTRVPCIWVAATYAFQYGTDPDPVQVCRFTPARPKAGGSSVPA